MLVQIPQGRLRIVRPLVVDGADGVLRHVYVNGGIPKVLDLVRCIKGGFET